MNITYKPKGAWTVLCMVLTGVVATVGATVLRVLLMPSLRDVDTGHFSANIPAMGLMLVALIAIAVFTVYVPRTRIDLTERQALPTSLAGLLSGALMGVSTVWDGFRWFVKDVLPPPADGQNSTLTLIVSFAMLIFGALGAIALIRWGLQVAAESGTRAGMSAWGALAPVLWAWFRLVRYEMSYASTIGWSQRFYDFFLVIFELLFLFKLARFVSGIGKATTGDMLFYSMGTAVFALSGALTRVILYFSADTEAYLATDMTGLTDFGIGVLALVFGWSLMRAYRAIPPLTEDDFTDDDSPYDPSLEPLLLSEEEDADENEEYNEP